jgi:hypothetical protein
MGMHGREHTHADHATYAAFYLVAWHSWKVFSFRMALRACSACYGVSRHST